VNPSEFVSTFLESVGQRQQVELYLRIFQKLPKQSFAVVATEPQLLRHATGVVVEALRFLSELDLRVTLALGLLGDSGPAVSTVHARLQQAGVPSSIVPLDPKGRADALGSQLRDGGSAIIDLRQHQKEERADVLAGLLSALGTRKFVVLRSRGGLGPHQPGRIVLTAPHTLLTHSSGISVVNLTTDLEGLLASRHLGRGEADLLRVIAKLHGAFPNLLTSVTSPFDLIRELFTVKGRGTLLKTGSTITRHEDFHGVDQGAIARLIEETFGKPLRIGLETLSPVHVFREQHSRGVALIQSDQPADYLSKFAVSPVARGEGIGRDLWEAVLARHPSLYWRVDPKNPIADWYARECDGLQRTEHWIVFWRGVDRHRIPELIERACSRPSDFGPAPVEV
jgi:acetylglutamate kinase